jgi:hypothetical protein
MFGLIFVIQVLFNFFFFNFVSVSLNNLSTILKTNFIGIRNFEYSKE